MLYILTENISSHLQYLLKKIFSILADCYLLTDGLTCLMSNFLGLSVTIWFLPPPNSRVIPSEGLIDFTDLLRHLECSQGREPQKVFFQYCNLSVIFFTAMSSKILQKTKSTHSLFFLSTFCFVLENNFWV